MQRTDLSLAVLQLKALGIDNIVRFEFPSAPPSKNLIACMELLYALGALDDKGRIISEMFCHILTKMNQITIPQPFYFKVEVF